MIQVTKSYLVVSSPNQKDHKDTQLLHWLLPNTKSGRIVSVRAFEFGSMYRLDISIVSPQHNTRGADHRLLGQSFFLPAKTLRRYSNNDADMKD